MEMKLQVILLIAVSTLGFVSFCTRIFCFFSWVWVMFLRPPKKLKEEYGSWAIITGSTDGIGKALAFELASKGLNLVLVGRNPSKLEATKNEIRARFGHHDHQRGIIQIKNIVVDFAKYSGKEISKAIKEGIEGLDIGILVNNAGVAYLDTRYFHEVDLEKMEIVVKVNVDAATWVTRSVLPNMLKKKKGAIVNIGSGSSAVLPSYPLFSIYASTKAYLATFSKCIYLEYRCHGIDIQCQIPLFVATKMTKFKKSGFIVASPETYAKASVRCIGYEQLSIPLWSHSVQSFILQAFPNAVLDWCIFRCFLRLRKRLQEKDQN